ncbi:MAG: GNAT family N-acetyltransferase [Clostridia bacterium]|nr:GNAT family N-acetyltransferase [Clostridia bacterium]
MNIRLKRAQLSDAEAMHRMQVAAFLPLFEKYHDTAINPACESVQRVREKIVSSRYYFIMDGSRAVGGIRVVDCGDERPKVISPLFILPECQNRGLAQMAVRAAERLHGEHRWRLDTILEEPGNCHLYEKLGYRRTGEAQRVRPNMTIVDYEKE